MPVDLRMRATTIKGNAVLSAARDANFDEERRREMCMASEHPFGRPSTGSQISAYSRRMKKMIMHVVVPRFNNAYKTAYENALHSSYLTCLAAAVESKARSVAILPLMHRKNGDAFSVADATHIAMRTIRCFLDKHHSKIDAVYVCVDSDEEGDENTASYQFKRLRSVYFPAHEEDLAYSKWSYRRRSCG